jgi:hypothetical protein
MYFLNANNRYSNVNSTIEALKLLSNTNNTKLISLVKGQLIEQEYYIYSNEEINKYLENYVSYIVRKLMYGKFNNKNDIPEEYQSFAIKSINWNFYGISKNNEAEYINSVSTVETDCKYIDTLKYKNEKLEWGLEIKYTVEKKLNWDKILEDILSGDLDLSKLELKNDNNHQQFANERFHPPPSLHDIFTTERKAELLKLCVLLKVEFPKYLDILSVNNLIRTLEEKLYLKKPEYKIDVKRKHKNLVDKKNTFRAEYSENATDKERSILPKMIRNPKTYKYYVKLVGLIKGRLHNMFLPSVSALSLIIDKTGLSMFGEPSTDPKTEALVILLMATMSYQKLFTIESQMHGGINKWLKAYLDVLISNHSNTTDFERIFKIIPSPRLIEFVPKNKLENIYCYVIEWLKLLTYVFEQQWKLGVETCVSKNMMVPKSGTTEINVNAWNACAGAWGNLTRYVRLIDSYLKREPLIIFKVLKMTAGDQMQWAASDGKMCHIDCEIFKKLTLEHKIMPWNDLTKLNSYSREDYVNLITQICKEYNLEPAKWLGLPKERTAENRQDVVSVCGVVVKPEDVQLCKDSGYFGSNKFNN